MKNFQRLYRLMPIQGPLKCQFEGDPRFIYSKVFFSRTIKFNCLIRVLLWLISPILWFVKSIMIIKRLISTQGKNLKITENISIRKQLVCLFTIAFVNKAHPYYYYYLKLHNSKYRLCHTFLINKHFIPLYSNLLGHNDKAKVIKNKIELNNHLTSLQGNLVQTDFILTESNLNRLIELIGNSDKDIFLKPVDGSSGQNCFLFKANQNKQSQVHSSSGALDYYEAIAQIEQILCNTHIIVQQRLINHQSIQKLSNGNLTTCRINTYIDKHENILPLFAMFLMPIGDSIISNGSKGSIISPVDLNQGKLGSAISLKDPFQYKNIHPNGQGPVLNTNLPNWSDALKLCLDAHSFFMEIPFIGWDIALTTEGPKLLEGNLGWSIEAWQLTHRDSFNAMAFISILRLHIEKKLASLNN